MSERDLRARFPAAIDTVATFFAQFYGDEIELAEDAESERLNFYVGPRKRTVALDADFLANPDLVEIRERLTSWNIAHLSRTLERGCILHITSDGPEEVREVPF